MIKKMIGLMVGTTLGSHAIQQIGNIGSGMSAGMKGATQSLIGIGLVGKAASLSKKVFKWT